MAVPIPRSDLAKQICLTFGLRPEFLIDIVSRFGPDQKDDARRYLQEKKTSEPLVEKGLQAFRSYWNKYEKKDYDWKPGL